MKKSINSVNNRTKKIIAVKDLISKTNHTQIDAFSASVKNKTLSLTDYMNMSVFVNVVCTSIPQLSNDAENNQKVISSIREKIKAAGVNKDQIIATLNYVKSFEYEYLVEIHDKLKHILSNETGLSDKLEYVPLNIELVESDLITLSDKFIELIQEQTAIPINMIGNIQQFKKQNKSLATFNESTFLVLNSIFFEHSISVNDEDTRTMVKEIYNNPLTKELMEYSDRVVEVNKQLVTGFSLIIEFMNSHFSIVDKFINEFAESVTTNTIYPLVYDRYEIETDEDESNESQDLVESDFTDKDSELIESENTVYTINAEIAKLNESEQRGLVNPKFILMTGLFEYNQFARFENLGEYIRVLMDNTSGPDKEKIIMDAQQMMVNIHQAIQKGVKVDLNSVPMELFTQIFKIQYTHEDFMSELDKYIKEYDDKLTEINTTLMQSIDPKLIDELLPKIFDFSESILSMDVEHKGLLLSTFDEKFTEKIGTYINLVQAIQMIEVGYIGGEDKHDLYTEIVDYINNDSQLKHIFELSNSIEQVSGEFETIKILKKVFETF